MMPRRALSILFMSALAGGSLQAGPVAAQFPACEPYPLSTNSNSTPLTSGLVTSTDFPTPRAFIAAGNQLKAFDPDARAWGWTVTLSGAVLSDPVPVHRKDGSDVVLVTVAGCRLVCLRATDGFVTWDDDLRDFAPDPGDEVGGSPAVQLWAASDSAFRASVPNDLVFAATHYVSTFRNRVYAINATDGSVRWTFNLAGTFNMSAASAGPTVDLARNTLYVGTEMSSPTQLSLWALKTTSGLKAWVGYGVSAGRISQRPLLAGARLYTVGPDNTVRATDCASLTGSPIWSLAMASSPVSDPVLDPDSGTPLIAMACAGSTIRSVYDAGTFATELSPLAGLAVGPVYLPGAGLFYAINTAGKVQEIDSATHFLVGSPATLCGDPETHLALSHLPFPSNPWRLSAVGGIPSGGILTQVCVPWAYGSQPLGCVTDVANQDPGAKSPGARLGSPSPNPTASWTRLEFSTSSRSACELLIADVLGRLVRRLSEDGPATGQRSLTWDGVDEAGRRLPAGIYSVRLSLDGVPAGDARRVLIVR